MNHYIRYRIGIINDFQNVFAYIDYQDWGPVQQWGCFRGGNGHPGFQQSTDSIGVFLNFKLVGEYKIKEEAEKKVQELLLEAPVKFTQFWDYLKI